MGHEKAAAHVPLVMKLVHEKTEFAGQAGLAGQEVIEQSACVVIPVTAISTVGTEES